MAEAASLALTTAVTAFVVNMAIASYGIFVRPSLMKKVVSLAIFADSINMFAISLGYRAVRVGYPSPPILESPELAEVLPRVSVDPLPQAFLITAIVINTSCLALILALIVRYYRLHRSLLVKEARGEEEL